MVQELHTIESLLNLSTKYLAEKGCASPRLDAEILMGHALQMSRIELYLNLPKMLTSQEVANYRTSIGRRGQRLPVAYITGEKEFYSLDFQVQPGVLIPRPETELLVEKVISLADAYFAQGQEHVKVLELGTGSGAIAVSIAHHNPRISLTAGDISPIALKVAAENSERHQVLEQITFVESDLFTSIEGEYKIICTNPPYIPSNELSTLAPEVGQEPILALDGGTDGLEYYRRIIKKAPSFLEKQGFLVLEIGWDQSQAIRQIANEFGFVWQDLIKDYSGHDRVVVLKWP